MAAAAVVVRNRDTIIPQSTTYILFLSLFCCGEGFSLRALLLSRTTPFQHLVCGFVGHPARQRWRWQGRWGYARVVSSLCLSSIRHVARGA
jgi:hypothetical protein